jgi:hypothetical protein
MFRREAVAVQMISINFSPEAGTVEILSVLTAQFAHRFFWQIHTLGRNAVFAHSPSTPTSRAELHESFTCFGPHP